MLDEVECTGAEPSLADCKSLGWLKSNCKHRKDASVVCSNGAWPRLPAQRVGPGGPGAGALTPLPLLAHSFPSGCGSAHSS